ncbi:MAG: hypothetical protein KF753_16005 [Caldilineaceae bacterium]|nr:hypothetical protein [Caldilineaceae bacterium]
MTTVLPRNDSDRLSLLRTAISSHSRDQAAGRAYLSPTTAAALEPLAAEFEAAIAGIAQAQANQQQTLAAGDTALAELQAQVRHTWNTVRWRVRWQDVSPSVLAYYHLRPRHTRIPHNRAAWLELAQRLLAGDAAAVADGYASAVDGPALQGASAELAAALDAINAAKQSLHSARQHGNRLRRQVNRLLRHLNGDLRHALRDASVTDQQQIMRTYGMRFRRTPGEATAAMPRSLASAPIMGWQLQAEPSAAEPVSVEQ